MTPKNSISQKDIKNYYECRYKKIYNKWRKDLKRIQKNLRELSISPTEWILDVGCGTGDTCEYLVQKGAKVIGLDISYEAVYRASQTKVNATFIQGNAEELPFTNSFFNKAIFSGTLEHFPHQEEALREIYRVLKPNSYVFFLVPNARFFLFKYCGGSGQIYEKVYTLEGWKRLFQNHGFKVKKIYKDIGPSIFRDNILRGILRKFILSITNLFPLQYTYQFVFICCKE